MKKILWVLLLASGVMLGGCVCCKQWMALQGQTPADPSVKWMWDKGCKPAVAPPLVQYEPAPQPLPPPPPPPPVVSNCSAKTYPCGGCEVVRLEKCMPPQVQTGAEFEYKIRVTNLTSSVLTNVVVTDTPVSNFQYKTSNPQADIQGNKLVWVFQSLVPKETKEITGTGIATASGIVQNLADVTYKMPVYVQSVSIQPSIVLTKTAPAEVSICEPINYTLKIENTGTGPANNVKIVDNLPIGLTTAQCNNKIEIPIGILPAGTARSILVPIKAQAGGTYTNSATAFADGNITVQSSPVTTVVKQPKLSITKTGPETQYIDQEAAYEITVTNTGDGPAIDTIIEDEIPSGTAFMKASQDGAVIQNKVMWKVAKLNPGDAVKTSAAYMLKSVGTIVNIARASAVCCDTVSITMRTEVKGIPAILLEVIDLADPVRIGNNTTYRIMVTNQGYTTVTNVAVKAMLEPQMEYVGCIGATNGTLAADAITFDILPSLAPRAKATWEVTVKAKAVVDVRFRTQIKSDQLDRVVEETESTHFYE